MKLGPLPDGRSAVANTGLSKSGQRTDAASSSRVAKPASAGAAPGASVTVSELAKSVGASSAPEFDSAKVEAVRTAINNGTYTVNAEAIADKLLANAKEMLRPQH